MTALQLEKPVRESPNQHSVTKGPVRLCVQSQRSSIRDAYPHHSNRGGTAPLIQYVSLWRGRLQIRQDFETFVVCDAEHGPKVDRRLVRE